MNIALIRLSALGDIVHNMVVLELIKKHYPNAHITWIVDKKFEAIVQHSPFIDAIVPIHMSAIKKFDTKVLRQEIAKLNALNFDVVIDTQGLLKSAIIARILSKKAYGLDKNSARESLASRFYDKKFFISCKENVIDRFATLIANSLDFSYTKSDIENRAIYLGYESQEYAHLRAFEEAVLFAIGSSAPNKNYPIEGYIEVINALDAKAVILWGSQEEYDKACQIAQQTSAKVAPKLSLNELKYLISKARMLIGSDSGPSHIAWAFRRPSIILFGYTPKTLMFETAINRAIEAKEGLDLCRFDKRDDCIKTIEPKRIIEKARRLFER